MISKGIVCIAGIVVGIVLGILITSHISLAGNGEIMFTPVGTARKDVIGFLPYWLLSKAKTDYKDTVTELAYFDLSIGEDGHIQKLQNDDAEIEPGWNALANGRAESALSTAKKHSQKLSLVVFGGNPETIQTMINSPSISAANLLSDVAPLMTEYKFTDLNLDVESTSEASNAARLQFLQFASELKHGLNEKKLGTLTVEMSPSDLIHKRLIDKRMIAKIADRIVIMGYDYHYAGSLVTGPVAPLFGAGERLEFDTQAGVDEALKSMPKEKLILGIPDYGYEWETIDNTPQASVIPGTGITVSSQRLTSLLHDCATCSAVLDKGSMEPYVIYKDSATDTYHQLFVPDKTATQAKVDFARKTNLKGLAVWALGYEDSSVLQPLRGYLK